MLDVYEKQHIKHTHKGQHKHHTYSGESWTVLVYVCRTEKTKINTNVFISVTKPSIILVAKIIRKDNFSLFCPFVKISNYHWLSYEATCWKRGTLSWNAFLVNESKHNCTGDVAKDGKNRMFSPSRETLRFVLIISRLRFAIVSQSVGESLRRG